MAVMTKRMRTQVANEIAIAAFVFVRQSRREGHANKITDLLLWEVADARGYISEADFSIRTVKRLAREHAQLTHEEHLIDF